ncbi:Zinc finger C2H2-type,Zinc finger, RING/FYVE/PHD-type [Cinara cedri]|uniref:Zinc finger C2H2-type,Zinc finger, RING/FYVE/PHD-type n=1 Tax=Cinara cedri TaxID=506608 RepID=A0A5E4MWP8_9HEMI|nr:Zinc finger C2H2-type,Zinc finger, RING/FYVE/PHD-type [Cinara cedri]
MEPYEEDSDDEEYKQLLESTRKGLPNLRKVIDEWEYLNIQKQQVEKLEALYNMLDSKKLSKTKFRSCQSVMCSLYSKYHKLLAEKEKLDAKNRNQLDECENKTKSSEINVTLNKGDLKLDSSSEISNNTVTSSNIENLTCNNQFKSIDNEFKRKNAEVIKNDESSSSKNLNNDDILPEFSDSRLRLNKLIGFATNASIEKLNIADEFISSAEIAKQVFNEINKQSKNTVICQNMLKDINMDEIDVNHVKQVIESIKNINMEPVNPPPLPSIDLKDFGKTQFELTSSGEPNNDNVIHENLPFSPHSQPQPIVNSVLSKSSTVRDKLNSDINVFHKIGSSSDPKQKFITALKPGTLIDLENSKVSRSSLIMESIRSNVPSKEKSSDNKQLKPYRDPRFRNNSLLNTENNNPGQSLLQSSVHQMIPSMPALINNAPQLSPNINLLPNLGSQQNSLSVYNGQTNNQISSSFTDIQPFINLSPTELNNTSNQSQFKNCRPSTLNHYKSNNDFISSDGQHSIPNLLHINPTIQIEPNMNNRDPALPNTYKCNNDLVVNRDPRSMKINRKIQEPRYRNFKEYREAKYGKVKYSNYNDRKSHNEKYGQRTFNLENEKFKNSNKTIVSESTTSFIVKNDTDKIKNFKIPKIKHKEELGIQNLKNDKNEKGLEIETIKNNFEKDSLTDTVKDNSMNTTSITETIINNNVEKNLKIRTIKDDDKIESNTDKSQKINSEELVINNDNKVKCGIIDDNDKQEVNADKSKKINRKKSIINIDNKEKKQIKNKQYIIKECIDEPTKAKKPKKCSKEKEFEKIVKEAASLNYDTCGPRTRTRSSLKKIGEPLKKVKLNKKSTILDVGECSKSIEHVETGQDVISSTSKESSEVSPVEGDCKNLEENFVSSNVINSTADMKVNQLFPNSIIDLQSPGLLTLIEILQDEQKRLKLQEFLNSTDPKSTNDDKPVSENISHEEFSHFEQKKMKKKMKKKKKRKRGKTFVDNSLNNEESNNAVLNKISDNSSNKESIVIDNSNSEIVDNSSTSQGKVKLSKRKKSKENYGSFEIKDKNLPNTELKDLKIVLAKYDKNKTSTSEISVQLQTPSEPKHIEVSKKVQRKKPSIYPLSIKVARENVANNKQNNLDENNQFKIIPDNKIISKEKANKQNCKSKNKKIKTDTVDEKEVLSVLAEPQNKDSVEESSTPVELPPIQGENSIIDQSSEKITPVQTNINNKTDTKKTRPKMTELDKLHADISEMYDCDALLNAPNIRHCRQNKQIDYCHNNTVVSSKKNKPSTIEQVDDPTNKFINNNKISKTKKQTKKSKLKTKKRVYTYKKCTKKTVAHKTFKSTLSNKNAKNHTKTKEKINVKVCKNNELNKESDNKEETIQVNNLKVLTPEDFKDKSYFQTADNKLECKLCNYNDVGLKIVRHYKEEHSEEEMLPSRLSVESAEILINESVKENFGYLNIIDSKPLRDEVLVNTTFTCVFCHSIFYDITCFYDHITCHTGEYRYNCKVCKVTYPSVLELEKHILEHSNYDKSEGIFHLLHSKPVGSNTIFGYLCPFCYYIQLDYQRIVNHMTQWHFDEDKKFNSYWTIIRVNMSIGDDDYTNSIIDYSNLVGCLPPVLNNKFILKSPTQETSVSTLVAQKKKAMKDAESSGIPLCNEDEVHLPKLNIQHSSPVDMIPPYNEELITITDEPMIEHQEYTLKFNSLKCTVAGLSCEVINSILLYKCSVSKCLNNQFSTVLLNELFKHIHLNHQHIVWDRRCDMCQQKFEKINEQYLLKDALEHIVSHHLVLREIQQPNIISNVQVMEKGQNSPSIDTVKSKEMEPIRVHSPLRIQSPIRVISPLRIRSPLRVRDDLFSTADKTKQQMPENMLKKLEYASKDTSSNNDEEIDIVGNAGEEDFMVENLEQQRPIVPDITIDIPVEQTNSIEVSNDTISPVSPVSMFCIQDVRSLRESEFGIFNDNISVVQNKNQYEVTNPRPDIYLESGQHIVNNGAPINGTYCLIDTMYQKNYLKKFKKLGANAMKSRLILKDMTSIPKLLGLFKCMDKSCTKVFSDKMMFKLHMQLHFSNMEKKKNNQINNAEQFKHCAYCFKKFDDVESLANHISEKYSFCKFFCPYCFYRAYTPNHVMVHQTLMHTTNKLKIIQLEYDEIVNDNSKEILMAVDYNDFVLPYKCNVGSCTFSCFVPGDFIYHLNKEHQQCDKFCCYICADEDNSKGFIALQPSLMIKHFILHNINVYQCIFCLFGSELKDSMMIHLAMEHFEYESICLERSMKSEICDSSKIENLKIIRIEKPINNGLLEIVNLPPGMSSFPENLIKKTKKRCLKQSNDVISKAIKIARIQDVTQSSKTVSLKVPESAQMIDSSSNSLEPSNVVENTKSSTIVIQVPTSTKIIDCTNSLASVQDNEFIMLDDDDQNDLRETLRINDIWTENVNTEVQLPQHVDDDIITIDDDDDDDDEFPDTLTETVTKKISTQQKLTVGNLPEESIDGLNKSKRKLSVENLPEESIDDDPNISKRSNLPVEHLTKESNNGPNKFKRIALPLIELNKLFFCKKCDKTYSKSTDFQKHLSNCPNWNLNLNERRQCLFCHRSFKTPFHMTEHVKLHGPNRFTCNLCNFNSPSCRSIGHHMRTKHDILNLNFIPVNAKFTDMEKDEFIVYDSKDQQSPKTPAVGGNIGFKCGECNLTSVHQKYILSHIKDVHNIDKYEVCVINSLSNGDFKELYEMKKINSCEKQITTKRLRHNNLFDQNIDKKDTAKPKIIVEDKNILSFSPDTIDNIPMMHIFSNPIGCLLCTYNTKVRSNLILHLNGHKKGQDNTTKEIVNPVPSIGKSELMFDKMINLSASSFEAMNSEKTKIDELNLKIVELFPINDLNTELFPKLIPKNKRFQCSEGTCNQQFFLDVDLLKTHMSIIHKDYQFYLCPHCPPNSIQTKEVKINNIELHLMYHTENLYKCQYCDYIDFNRNEMRKHMRNVHLSLIVSENQSNIIVIRQSKIEDYSIDRNIIQVQLSIAQWICNLCTSSIKYTEREIISHLFLAHNATKMYRCPMCSFEQNDDNAQKFEEHFKAQHPNIAYKSQKVCDKVTDSEQLPIQSKNLMGKTTNNQEQQALESIEPLMPPSCRGIPIESIYTSKSRGVSKSPKSAKKSPVQARKQKLFQDDFNEDDSLGTISTTGQFVCPKCDLFKTTDLENFREHLYKEINNKRWQCLTCFLISDSPKKMAWHVKKHGIGAKYKKIENIPRLKWVERVIEHQHPLSIEFNKQNAEEDVISVGKTIAVINKSILKTKKGFPGKKVAMILMTNNLVIKNCHISKTDQMAVLLVL